MTEFLTSKNICKNQGCGPRKAGFARFQVLKSSHMKDPAAYILKDSLGICLQEQRGRGGLSPKCWSYLCS